MIRINQNACVGCGACCRDCFPSAIEMKEGKAHFIEGHNCMECGHCVAICPENAVQMEGYDPEDLLELKDLSADISSETYLNHLKSRRSIRAFTDRKITREEVEKIIEAGRYSPTGGNTQTVAYHVLQERLPEFREMALDELKRLGQIAKQTGNKVSWYSDFWLKVYDEFHQEGIDELFFDAGTVIAISSNSPQAAIIAAAHMETMVYTMGLGMVYSGFTTRAVGSSAALQEFLHLKEGYNVWAVLVIGEPKVKYRRTVQRKKADVSWD